MSYEHGTITDQGIAKLRERIGQGFPGRQPWRTEVNRDAIWHLAHAIGDLSPVYTDPEYAKSRTPWGKLQCPGVVLRCFDTLSAPGSAGLPEGLPGVHSIWSGSHYEWERPILIGDRVVSESYLKDVVEKESKFTDGRTVYQTYEAVYHTAEGEYLGKRSDTYMRADRNKAREKSVYKADELAHWNDGDIARFMGEYKKEQRTEERFWEDVEVGDEIGKVIKGPLTGTAEIAFESFFGVYLIGNAVAARALEKHPKLMVPNEQGVPEPPQRVHWDNKFTQDTLGLPGAYDLGLERLSWMCHAVTNWVGNGGFLSFIDARYRRFNYLGDVTWATGKVAEKFERDGKKLVRLDLWTTNHREQITATAVAEATLASRHA